MLKPLIRKTQPYARKTAHRGIWVEPSLLAEIEYRAKSAAGKVRHPFFKGIREDLRWRILSTTSPRVRFNRERSPELATSIWRMSCELSPAPEITTKPTTKPELRRAKYSIACGPAAIRAPGARPIFSR